MRVAVLNEVSAADKNPAIMAALEGRNLELINPGMKSKTEEEPLLYTHTGLMSALLLHLEIVDFVVGGCGTGQGYLNSVMQYPGVGGGPPTPPPGPRVLGTLKIPTKTWKNIPPRGTKH